MSNIAIIDDNVEASTTLKRALNIHLKKQGSSLVVIDQTPFRHPEEYFSFINEKAICALILDERLNELPIDGDPVDYKGNQLVDVLRERLKDFPIYMITAHAGDEDVLAKESQFEMVINRRDITTNLTNAFNFTIRLARSALRYYDANFTELAEFNELSALFAKGDSAPEVATRIRALQTKLELPISAFDDRRAWLDKYETEIANLEKLREKLQKMIEKK